MDDAGQRRQPELLRLLTLLRERVSLTAALALLTVPLLVVAAYVDDGQDVTAPTGALRDEPSLPDTRTDAAPSPRADLPSDTTMVWSGFRLGDGYATAVADEPRVPASTVVRGEVLDLIETRDADGEVVDELPDGWSYPVEVLAFEPERYDHITERELIGPLAEDEALLSATSAEVRRLGVGGRLRFADGTELEVTDVVPDEVVGAAEVAVRADGPLPVETEKYLLARPDTPEVRDALTELGAGEREPRLVPHGDDPVLRHAHSVLPTVERKAHFGEFAMRDLPGRDIRAGQSWVDEHITAESVPILGRVECHRELIEPLRAAMQELIERGAEHVIEDYAGCWVPRTSGSSGPPSSHAWGVSIDFNARANPYGAPPDQPDVLVEVMSEHGFLWGGDWDVPDAMHFELAPGRDTSR